VAALWADEDLATEAFRSGAGVPWGEHDERLFCGVAAFFRSGYQASLVSEWLPALDGVVERLEAGAKVADVGCGHGHSTVLMAQAYPASRFHGYDAHPDSVAEARANAERAGVSDRVTFEVATAAGYADSGFDLIAFFDALHDMGDPVGAAKHARHALAPGGSVMLVEPIAGDDVTDNVGMVAKIYYAASTMLCTAHALSEDGGYALGAQAGPERLAEVMRTAGFGDFRKAAETPFNLIAQVRA
jgi:cyclopropane fatty-acyl-phospholipid synthase-like methyltransferase